MGPVQLFISCYLSSPWTGGQIKVICAQLNYRPQVLGLRIQGISIYYYLLRYKGCYKCAKVTKVAV